MSDHDDRLPMTQMLEHAREALDLVRRHNRSELAANRLLQVALIYFVQIVGEAATRVSADGQARHADIPWRRAIATRNRLIHGYDRVDHDVVWDTIAEDFPDLVAALERALASGSG